MMQHKAVWQPWLEKRTFFFLMMTGSKRPFLQ